MAFDPKNKAHKAQLYSALTAAAELNNAHFDDFIQTPFTQPWNLAPGYRRNLQRGDYAVIRAQTLYDWMMGHHFTIAHKTAPEIFPETPEMRLQRIVDEHAITGKLRLVLAKTEFGIVEHVRATQDADHLIKLGQAFYFELDAEEPGYAVAFQVVRNQWHPIPLIDVKYHEVEIISGTNILPRTTLGKPNPIRESHDMGLHQFVVITAKNPGLPLTVKGLIEALTTEMTTVQKLTVTFAA